MDFAATHQAVFWHDERWDNRSPHIFTHALTPTDVNAPAITVAISCLANHIHLSYFIKRTDWLDLPPASDDSCRTDYLWEQNCLECFFEFDHQAGYIELNFSPNSPSNHYNLYQFTDYRTPNITPPLPTAGQVVIKHGTPSCTHHSYHLWVCLDSTGKVSKIHPCAILYRAGKPIFYAIRHATSPDFHDKAYWQTL